MSPDEYLQKAISVAELQAAATPLDAPSLLADLVQSYCAIAQVVVQIQQGERMRQMNLDTKGATSFMTELMQRQFGEPD
jgi:hypothetical protein